IILFLVSAAGVFSWVLTYGNVPQQVASWITGVAHSPLAFMLLLVAVLLLVGTMIDGAPALIMIVPILLPIAMETYGINPYHFGVIAVLTLGLAFMTPPVGLCLYVASAICNMSPLRVFKATLTYFFVSLIVVLILTVFPKLSKFILYFRSKKRRHTMKRYTFIQGAGVSALGVTLGFPTILLAQEKREFRLGIATPPKHPWNETAARIGEILAEKTDERLSISVFPAGQLGSEAAMLQQLQSG